MKQISYRSLLLLLIVALSSTLFSFKPFGGEGYVVLVNNKVVLERYGKDMKTLQTLHLDQYPADAQVTIRYYNCGNLDKARTITFKNDKNQVIRSVSFGDATNVNNGMNCTVQDLRTVQKNNAVVHVYYTSKEIPEGRLILAIDNSSTVAAIKK